MKGCETTKRCDSVRSNILDAILLLIWCTFNSVIAELCHSKTYRALGGRPGELSRRRPISCASSEALQKLSPWCTVVNTRLFFCLFTTHLSIWSLNIIAKLLLLQEGLQMYEKQIDRQWYSSECETRVSAQSIHGSNLFLICFYHTVAF